MKLINDKFKNVRNVCGKELGTLPGVVILTVKLRAEPSVCGTKSSLRDLSGQSWKDEINRGTC